jgi:hypothetical protein
MNTTKGTQDIIEQVGIEVSRKARRNMFWKLYTLPWLILTLLLLTGMYYAFETKPEYYSAYTNSVMQVKSIEVELMKMREAAMLTGNGKWITSPSGSNQFVYTMHTTNTMSGNEWDIGRIYKELEEEVRGMGLISVSQKSVLQEMYKISNEMSAGVKLIEDGVMATKGIGAAGARREAPSISSGVADRNEFTGRDYLLAKSVNYNLEEEMVRNLRELVALEIGGWDIKDNGGGNGSKRELVKKLQDSMEGVIRSAFDGFRTYNRLKKE